MPWGIDDIDAMGNVRIGLEKTIFGLFPETGNGR